MKKCIGYLRYSPFLLFWIGFVSYGVAWGSDGMAGSATCKMCHAGHYDSYMASIHAQKAVPQSPANKEGCESCHGAGAAHAKKPSDKSSGVIAFGKKTKNAQGKSAKCLNCHDESTTAFWDLGRHQTAGISCDACHTAHSGTKKNLKAREPELCNTCHRNIASRPTDSPTIPSRRRG